MPSKRVKGSEHWVIREVSRHTLVLAFTLLAFSQLTAPRTAWAAPSDSAPLAAETLNARVELHVTGSERALGLMRATSRELFDRLGVDVEVIAAGTPAPPAQSPPLAIVHVQLTPPQTNIVILDGTTGEPIDRRSVPDATTIEAAVEATTHIAYFVVETLLLRAAAEPVEPKPVESEPKPEPELAPSVAAAPPASPSEPALVDTPSRQAPRADGLGFEAGVGLGITSLGDSRILPGLGILAELRAAGAGGPFAALTAATHASSELELEGASASLRLSALRLLGGFDVYAGRALAISLALGGGVDWLQLSRGSSTAEVEVSRSRSLIYPLLTGAGGMRLKVTDRLLLSALGGADLSLIDHQFQATVDGQRQVLLSAPTLRPFVLLVASASLDASSRFDQRREP